LSNVVLPLPRKPVIKETGRRDADLSMSNNPMRVPKMLRYAAGAEPAAQDLQPALVPAWQSNYHSIC
jgi:hypothetical protein